MRGEPWKRACLSWLACVLQLGHGVADLGSTGMAGVGLGHACITRVRGVYYSMSSVGVVNECATVALPV